MTQVLNALVQADHARINREELYMSIAHLFAQRSTCLRGQVGCVAVKNNHIVCAGYNGAPPGMPHCLEVGCGGSERVWVPDGSEERGSYQNKFPNGCTRAVHAEMNMVAFAARHGISLEGATVFNTAGPCLPCAQALVSAGIAEFWWHKEYWRMKEGLALIDKANIKIMHYGDH